jgi:hypothetical protein
MKRMMPWGEFIRPRSNAMCAYLEARLPEVTMVAALVFALSAGLLYRFI